MDARCERSSAGVRCGDSDPDQIWDVGLTLQARKALVELGLIFLGCHPFGRRPRVRHRPLALLAADAALLLPEAATWHHGGGGEGLEERPPILNARRVSGPPKVLRTHETANEPAEEELVTTL